MDAQLVELLRIRRRDFERCQSLPDLFGLGADVGSTTVVEGQQSQSQGPRPDPRCPDGNPLAAQLSRTRGAHIAAHQNPDGFVEDARQDKQLGRCLLIGPPPG